MNSKVWRIYCSMCASGNPGSQIPPSPFDVVVYLTTEEKYVASFFTYEDIETIRKENQLNGTSLGGLYFWHKNMIIVEDSSEQTIKMVIEGMLEEGDFFEAFHRI